MIGIDVKTINDAKVLEKKIKDGRKNSLFKVGGFIRKVAQNSLKTGLFLRGKPGTMAHSPTRSLKNSILFAVSTERGNVIIGPQFRKVGKVGSIHEFGKTRFGRKYPARPFMGPALKKSLPTLPKLWAGSVR